MILPRVLIEKDGGELGCRTGCKYVKQTITIWQRQKASVAKKCWYGFLNSKAPNG